MSFWAECRALHAELVEKALARRAGSSGSQGTRDKKPVVSQAPSAKRVSGTHGQPGQERMTAKEYRELMGLQ